MWRIFTAVIGISGALIHAEERPLILPFEVTIGGHKAVMEKENALFAVVSQPVKADAVLTIEKVAPMLIINAFACKEDGTVEQNAPAAVIFTQNTASTPLDATMDKKPLKPGTYLMNIVAHNTTARVVFTVEDPSGEIKLPTVSSIFKFLKGGSKSE
jgi:hypothetical protein